MSVQTVLFSVIYRQLFADQPIYAVHVQPYRKPYLQKDSTAAANIKK